MLAGKIMSKNDLGDQLYITLSNAQGGMFNQGRMLQLSYNAFEFIASSYNKSKDENIKLKYPLGLHHSGEAIIGEVTYKKKELIKQYSHLAEYQLPLNGIYQLVSITETMFGDLIREILLQYPKKIGSKRTLPVSTIFECSSLEAVHLSAISVFINEMSYKSTREFAESASGIFGFKLLEIPAFHRFIEIKATRDVFIHNKGIVNAIYKKKAGSFARVESGKALPITIKYFLESYEFCLKLAEVLMDEFHNTWYSQAFVKSKQKKTT